jgi:hypothetical protein
MKKTLLTFAIFALSTTFALQAQNQGLPQELTEEDVANFKLRVKEKVEAFQNHISIIADKQQDLAKRDLAMKAALRLFLVSATMEVSSKATDGKENKREMPMKEYLNRLKSLPFRTVKISSQDVCYISNIQPTPDGKYVATATIYQIFEGYYSETNCYKDFTKKEIDVSIEYKEDDFGEKRWVIMLGNVKVVETKRP